MFSSPVLSEQQARQALDRAAEQVRVNLPLFTGRCQNHSSVDNIYPDCDNDQWTCGFWPGEIWLSYEHTRDEVFRIAGQWMVPSFHHRIVNRICVDHHDMGFLYTPSCVAPWKLVGDTIAREAALLAAEQLLTRFHSKGEFFQAWGAMDEPGNRRFIIDCLLNLPLLYWASQETGDPKFRDTARKHMQTCLRNSFRPDGSTFHTFFMRPDGTPDRGETCQGYRADSFWARGQAWGIYGSVLSYRYEPRQAYLDTFRKALEFYLSRLPGDLVPYWDMIFQEGGEEPRDSSSAAIVACALLEGERHLPEMEAVACRRLAGQMLWSLTENYVPTRITPGGGQLLHGTYSKKSPYNTCTPEGVDEFTAWGDYFYMEALTRYLTRWNPYW